MSNMDSIIDIKIDIKALRKKLGNITQAELANMLGLSISTVMKWEQGKFRPSKLAQKGVSRLERRANKVKDWVDTKTKEVRTVKKVKK